MRPSWLYSAQQKPINHFGTEGVIHIKKFFEICIIQVVLYQYNTGIIQVVLYQYNTGIAQIHGIIQDGLYHILYQYYTGIVWNTAPAPSMTL